MNMACQRSILFQWANIYENNESVNKLKNTTFKYSILDLIIYQWKHGFLRRHKNKGYIWVCGSLFSFE